MNKYFRCLSWLLVLSAGQGIAFASQEEDISSFSRNPLKHITNRDGLPQVTIVCMATDSVGRLWVGTQDGAAFYDQRRWTTVNMPNRTISNWVQSMFVASDGAIWFGTATGPVYRYARGTWRSFDASDGLAGTTVRHFCETIEANGERAIWFATDHGLSKYAGGRWVTYTQQNGLADDFVYDVFRSDDGSLWVGTERGISRRAGNGWLTVDVPAQLRGKVISNIRQSVDGAMWFAGRSLVARFDRGTWKVFSLTRGSTHHLVNAIYPRRNGEIWFGGQNGVWKYSNADSARSDSTLESVSLEIERTEKEGVIVLSMHETFDGSLWLGTFLGLYRHGGGKWQSVVERMGTVEGGPTAICETSNGDFWFGTERGGLVRYHKGGWKTYTFPQRFVLYLYESMDRSLWINVLNRGAFRFKDGTVSSITKADGLATDSPWFTYQTKDGALWFGGEFGASKYAHGKWEVLTMKDGLADNAVLSIRETKDGSLWFGTRKGITRYHNGTYRTFTTKDGLGNNDVQCIFEPTTAAASMHETNAVWFGTSGNGASRYDLSLNTWRTFNDTTSPRLSNNVVYRIEEDKQGRFYFLTIKGVTRFTFLDNGKIKSEIFTTEDGLPNNEGNFGSSIVDSRGRIWVGTTEGAAFLDPSAEVEDTVRKPLFIRDVSVSGLVTNPTLESGVILQHNQNEIIFHFSLSSFFKESDTRYQVQLNGYDTDRLNWTSDDKKEYTNLPDGEYTFRVWGKDYAGNKSGPAEFAFVIEPPYWKTWWFRGVLSFLFVGALLMVVRLYTARKVKKQTALLERQQMIERERTRISQDMHDTVGSSLTRIALLSDWTGSEVQPQRIAEKNLTPLTNRLNLIGSTAREVIETMDEIIWSLSPTHDSLESLIGYVRHFVNTMFESTGIQHKFNAPESIPDLTLRPDFRRNAFLIIKEAINNAVRHSGASSVSVIVSLAEGKLKFEVIDDGVGIRESSALESGEVGFGLKNMRERAKAIGAKLEIESFPQRGAAVRLSAELQTKYTI